VRIDGNGELDFAVNILEELAGVSVWGEEFDDGLGIEIESGIGRFASGAAMARSAAY
jgi:hypothetical protein